MNSISFSLILLGLFTSGVMSLNSCNTGFRVRARAPRQQQGQQQQFGRQGPQQGPQPQIEWIETGTSGATNAFTITWWVYHDTSTCADRDFLRVILEPESTRQEQEQQQSQAGLNQQAEDSAPTFIIKHGVSGMEISIVDGASVSQVFIPTLDGSKLANGWHHVAVSWSYANCGQLQAYVDGQLWGTGKLPLQDTVQFEQGSLSAVTNAAVCDVTIQWTNLNMFSAVLSPQQISELAACSQSSLSTYGDQVSYKTGKFTRLPETVQGGSRTLLVQRPTGLPAQCCL